MTVNELIKRADALLESDIPLERRLEFISEAEGLVGCEVLGLALADIPKYTAENTEVELLAAPPHDKLYLPYLTAMLALYDGDTASYENHMSLFNSHFAEYSGYIARRKDKTGSAERDCGIYLSAYAIAVKHGYRGSEEDWLSELDGAVKAAEENADNAETAAASCSASAEKLESLLAECNANVKASADSAEKAEIYAAEGYRYSLYVKTLHENTLTAQKIAQSAQASAQSSLENTRASQAIAQSAEASAKASVENARTAQAIAQAAEKTAKDAADAAKASADDVKSAKAEAKSSADAAEKSAAEAKASENAVNERASVIESTVSELDGKTAELEAEISALEGRISALEAAIAATDTPAATADTADTVAEDTPIADPPTEDGK